MNNEERAQCEKVWKQYIALLQKMCKLKLRSMPSEIDDVISDVFLAFCEKVDTSGFPKNTKNWLYGTLNNIILKRYRAVGTKKAKTVDVPNIEDIPDENNNDIANIDDTIFIESVKKLCDEKLKEKEKALFQYVFVDNMTMKEIAEILQTSEAAVRQRYHRLCVHMRKMVNNNDVNKKFF